MGRDLGLDRNAERMLVMLADDGPLKTSALRERLELKKNQAVNYRGKRVLGGGRDDDDPALGFVQNDGDGMGTSTELTWWLTELGQEWVRQHRDDLESPQDAKEAVELVRELQDEIDSLRGRIQQAEGKVSQLGRSPVKSKEGFSKSELNSTGKNSHDIHRLKYDIRSIKRKNEQFGKRLSNIEDILLDPERER
ncbi:hypothetical protein [Haloarcula marina]|uniref:hypothetical protein n=1 Tax=Haloarcula marina TaxID=2961574 RepID=UPI0020B639A0|nr:hypothetical protein [Halomicroarcula marina]